MFVFLHFLSVFRLFVIDVKRSSIIDSIHGEELGFITSSREEGASLSGTLRKIHSSGLPFQQMNALTHWNVQQ